jgi:tetrapyrrole methylase family protein/MazG family protein/ATP diphosphatase
MQVTRADSTRSTPASADGSSAARPARPFDLPARLPVEQQHGQTLPSLVQLMQRLLAPDGCPWDREQTPASLRRYVLEEACEVMDAIDSGEGGALREELGDLLLQVVFLAELARKLHGFGPDDVVFEICEKLVRRHPHVFEDTQLEDAGAVARQWDVIKAREKPKRRELLARVPRSLPPLERARQIGKEVQRVGFDWPDASGSRAKLSEELGELDAAVASGDTAEIEAELGDLLFAAVNLARHHGVDAGRALQQTNDRFCHRFAHVERRVRDSLGDWPRDAEGKPTRGIALEQLDSYWNEAKALGKPSTT